MKPRDICIYRSIYALVLLGLCTSFTACPSASKSIVRNAGPPADRDGDGIPDDRDSCPGHPGPTSNRGCPIIITRANSPRSTQPTRSPAVRHAKGSSGRMRYQSFSMGTGDHRYSKRLRQYSRPIRQRAKFKRLRLKKRKRIKLKFNMKRKKTAREVMEERSGQELSRARPSKLNGLRIEPRDKTTPKKPKKRVWKRSKSNTTLSKVSVGGGKTLKLKKMRMTVQVEGLRARTIIDHIYYNPHNARLEGKFKYTLPPNASVSYYAMFLGRPSVTPSFFAGKGPAIQRQVRMQPQDIAKSASKREWGELREARLKPAERAREVYEHITRQKIDPALLEQDAPNTFSGRVFPIQPNGYNRVIIAYEQTLPKLGNQQYYRFRFPSEKPDLLEVSVEHNPGLSKLSSTNLKKIRCKQSRVGTTITRCVWEKNTPQKDAIFYYQPKQKDASWTAGFDPTNGKNYLLASLKANLPSAQQTFSASHGIFMVDTSLSTAPDRFALYASLMQKILKKNQAQLKKFNVLFFDIKGKWLRSTWFPNTALARQKLHATVQKILLEGGTDLGQALQTLAHPPSGMKNPKAQKLIDVFFLSDGLHTWGEARIDRALSQFNKQRYWKRTRFFAYQTTMGVENLAFMKQLTRQGGAVYTCQNLSELDKCATAHTHPAMFLEKVSIGGIGAKETLVLGRQTALYPGASITLGTRYQKDGQAIIKLHGQYLGKPKILQYRIKTKRSGTLAARAWGELAVRQLTELERPELTKLIVAYAQHFRIPNKHCSFLILETDKEYKQYGLDKEIKHQKASDLQVFLKKTRQTYTQPVSEKQRWIAFFRKKLKKFKHTKSTQGRAVMSLLYAQPDKHFVFQRPRYHELWKHLQTSKRYRQTLRQTQGDFSVITAEAKRRWTQDKESAIRCLSSVVEKHANNARSLRFVSYYLSAWQRSDLAIPLLWRVLQKRSFEPHSYRDLARALLKNQRFALAAALYETLLLGRWDNRFPGIQIIAKEEYALLLKDAQNANKGMPSGTRSLLNSRKTLLGLKVKRAKMRITATWNTDNTDIDLWVIEPRGQKCWYRNKNTTTGGQLLADATAGYGPERYQNQHGPNGKYTIKAQYFSHSRSSFGNQTHVNVLIVLHPGTAKQRIIEKSVILKKRKAIVPVHQVEL